MPWYLEVDGNLTGIIGVDSTGPHFTAYGSGGFTAGGAELPGVNFSVSVPGAFNWQNVLNSINQIAQFFVNRGVSVNQIVQILQNAGYQASDILNTLDSMGLNGTAVLSSLETLFGALNSSYFDIWVDDPYGALVLDVSGGSQAPNAPVIDWTWNNGYNQDWGFVPAQYPGWYELVNRGSGQCLSVGNNSPYQGQQLVQYPCFGGWDQLWYIGTFNTWQDHVITSASSGMVIDVAGAPPYRGGTIDQWPYNGGWNQKFYFTNSGN